MNELVSELRHIGNWIIWGPKSPDLPFRGLKSLVSSALSVSSTDRRIDAIEQTPGACLN